MFTLHLFFVTITFSIKRNHPSLEKEESNKRIKSLYECTKDKVSHNFML